MNRSTRSVLTIIKLIVTLCLLAGISCCALTAYYLWGHLYPTTVLVSTIPPEPEEQQLESADYRVEGFGSSERSTLWASVRSKHLESFPECAACGSTEDLNVHHIKPFHLFPELELEPSNLITLCRRHHFNLGHRKNWKDWNPYVKEDAALIRKLNHERESK